MAAPLARASCYVPRANLGFARELTRAEASKYLTVNCSNPSQEPQCKLFRQTFFSNTPKARDLHVAFGRNDATAQTEINITDLKDECASPEDPDIFIGEIVPLHLSGVVQPSEHISHLQLRQMLKQLQAHYRIQDPTLSAALQNDSAALEHPLGQLVLNQLAYMNVLQFSLLEYFSTVYSNDTHPVMARDFHDLEYAPSRYTNNGELSALITFPQDVIERMLRWSSIQLGWAQDTDTIPKRSKFKTKYSSVLNKLQAAPLQYYPTELLAALDPNSIDPRKLFADRAAFLDLQADWIEPTSDNNFDTHWNAVILALGLATADTEPEEVVGEYAALRNSAQARQRGFWQNAIFEAWEKTRKPVEVDLVGENQTSPAEARPPQSSAAVIYRADTPP